MKIPVLPAVALLSLLVLHSAQGAALGSPEEEATIANYALGSENFNTDEFLNWHALIEFIKKSFPFFNWEVFPKLKGMRSAVPDSQ
ncbi:keratinocyte differentiation-associated protein isoform X2 [Heterocephalus glaber]|uniref:Keratinocyte differentiation-associated protein isoform X2 n=1 Tax=Heterocephalus glaber TaxID=10181 RepID=A0AAX6RHN1_HETGA|nr:keratinocyte differentiation-associated protein isoform X2 [Heterocephalus glaber]